MELRYHVQLISIFQSYSTLQELAKVSIISLHYTLIIILYSFADIPHSYDSDMDNHTLTTACAFVNFTRCDDEVCIDLKDEFKLEDDNSTNLEQTFNYILMEETLLPIYSRESIIVDDRTGNITVEDNDGKFQRYHYCKYHL